MSKESGSASSVSVSGGERQRGRVVGVPKRCWCGSEIVAKISKSEANPYRRYYRCAFAASRKLVNDNHIFKWFDEATLEEIESLRTTMSMEIEKMAIKTEIEIFGRVEEALVEAKYNIKKMMVLVCLGCVIIVVIGKLV